MDIAIWEPLEAKYKPKLIELAQKVADDMRKMHPDWDVSEVDDFTDTDLAVMFLIRFPSDSEREPIDLTFRLLDAAAWDGEENGTSFSLDIVAEGGRIVGGCHPFNYSPDVWVNPADADAVENRWKVFRDFIHTPDIANVIEEYK